MIFHFEYRGSHSREEVEQVVAQVVFGSLERMVEKGVRSWLPSSKLTAFRYGEVVQDLSEKNHNVQLHRWSL